MARWPHESVLGFVLKRNSDHRESVSAIREAAAGVNSAYDCEFVSQFHGIRTFDEVLRQKSALRVHVDEAGHINKPGPVDGTTGFKQLQDRVRFELVVRRSAVVIAKGAQRAIKQQVVIKCYKADRLTTFIASQNLIDEWGVIRDPTRLSVPLIGNLEEQVPKVVHD